ncbi:MAG: hypothetical protein AABY64_09760 [Bdellovibrionota bacterium]
MKMINTFKFILLSVLLTGSIAFSKATKTPVATEMTYTLTIDAFKKLPLKQKEAYIKNLQDFMVRADFGNDPSLKTSLRELLIANSYAAEDSSNSCIFAGYIQTLTRDKGRRRCPKPIHTPTETCPESMVMCNPILFGKDVCISEPFNNATENCQDIMAKKEGSIKEIVSAVSTSEASMREFARLHGDIDLYCVKPWAFNKKNCATLKRQTDAIVAEYRLQPKRPAPAATDPASVTPAAGPANTDPTPAGK